VQEGVVRFYDESFDKTYGMIRMGTVLGQKMPATTAANVFIESALHGEPITPFKHSMYRPMFFVDIRDVTEAYLAFASGILYGQIPKSSDSLSHIVNFFLPKPVTVLDLAHIVSESVRESSKGVFNPEVKVTDKGLASPFSAEDREGFRGDARKSRQLLHIEPTTSVRESIDNIVRFRLAHLATS